MYYNVAKITNNLIYKRQAQITYKIKVSGLIILFYSHVFNLTTIFLDLKTNNIFL